MIVTDTFENRIAPFLWLHGESHDELSIEIKKIHECGIGAVCLESRTHEQFAQKEWFDDIRFIISECRKYNMKIWILDDKHFPSGYANGIFEDKRKDLQPWIITENYVCVCGPVKDGMLLLPKDGTVLSIIACEAKPNSEELTGRTIDITKGIFEDMVYFDLPEGIWKVVFIIKMRDGLDRASLVFCDKLNPEATQAFIDEVYEPHYRELGEFFGTDILGFFSDEPSFRNNIPEKFGVSMGEAFAYYPWNDRLEELLKKRLADEFYKLLPALWHDFSDDKSAYIRFVYMDIITKEYKKNFTEKISEWCHKHGVGYIGHVIEDNNAHVMTGNGCGHYFRALESQDMAGVDVVLHQIIPGLADCSNTGAVGYKTMDNDFFHYVLAKLASSLAKLNPSMRGDAMCEIFGAYGWAEGTKIMKWLADHMLVRGINYFVPHAFSPKPYDPDCPPHFYANGRNPQFKYYKTLMDYINRCANLLSGGMRYADCAVLYDAEECWAMNTEPSLNKTAKLLYDAYIDYDIVPLDYLGKFSFDNNKAIINQAEYSVIVVPNRKYLTANAIEILNMAIQCGVKVVCVNDLNALECEMQFSGAVITDYDNLCEAVKEAEAGEFTINGTAQYLRFCHYIKNGKNIYMFTNESLNIAVDADIFIKDFNTEGYTLYDAMENTEYTGSGSIHLKIEPYNSIFIIEGYNNKNEEYSKKSVQPREELNIEWSISLAEKNVFRPYIKTKKLFNITGKSGLPRFSGQIKYEGEFETETKRECRINLGKVGETAELSINGKCAGTRIVPPYSFNITDYMQEGKNTIEVIVTNTLGYREHDELSSYLLFEPSGMLGPIELEY